MLNWPASDIEVLVFTYYAYETGFFLQILIISDNIIANNIRYY